MIPQKNNCRNCLLSFKANQIHLKSRLSIIYALETLLLESLRSSKERQNAANIRRKKGKIRSNMACSVAYTPVLRTNMRSEKSVLSPRFERLDGIFCDIDGRFCNFDGSFCNFDGSFCNFDGRFCDFDGLQGSLELEEV